MGYGDIDGRVDRNRYAVASEFCDFMEKQADGKGLMFSGFSVRYKVYEAFMVLRFTNGGEKYVMFISSSDLGACMQKAVGQINSEGLQLKADQY